MSLYNDFCKALIAARVVAVSSHLQLLAPYIKEIDAASARDTTLLGYCEEMKKLLKNNKLMLDGQLISSFIQLFGEAHFATICLQKSVPLKKIPEEKGKKTPDFIFSLIDRKVYFEVKTLSVVDGGHGINRDLSSSMDAQIDIEQQQRAGKKVAIGVSELQPYADKLYTQGVITAVISTLIEKARQNIKTEQYSNPNTFLVLNLCLIPPVITDNRALCSAYCEDYLFPKAITGDLWMLAFAQPGMLVHGQPEFEGKPCIEGFIQKCGILADPEFANISGLLIVVYPLGTQIPLIYGLYRELEHLAWIDNDDSLILTLRTLTGTDWNDDKDSNGWQLLGDK